MVRTPNVGEGDGIIRYIVAIAALALPATGELPLIPALVSVAIGLSAAVTGTIRFCPLYRLLGFSTARTLTK